MTQTVGVAAVARATFDTEFAADVAATAFEVIESLGFDVVGSHELLCNADAVDTAIDQLDTADVVVVLQSTFTDATLVEPFATLGVPLVLWAFPEERTGGRLRLNSLCGINLAAYGLNRAGVEYRWLYRDPGDAAAGDELLAALSGRRDVPMAASTALVTEEALERATAAQAYVAGVTVGLIGDAPTGFEPSAVDADELASLTGAKVDRIELDELFEIARSVPDERVAAMGEAVSLRITGVDELDPEPVAKSLAMHAALDTEFSQRGWHGVAMRCWPETFNEYGAAACSALSFLSEHGVPACCERDVYGTVTALALQYLAGGPAFVADLVDLDRATNTGVLWHCGLAPLGLADPEHPPAATIHSNRRKPLLNEFALRPGRVTIARLSQSGGAPRLVVGGGTMLREPLAFSGTAGVVEFDRPVRDVLDTIMGQGLEHHYGIAYGDVAAELEALAGRWGIPVVEL
ncbi:MAG: hypothetical protein HKN01_07100 [Acidimicrobiia bacterium]|nr:hypothetical protein [Acidimicrobiia bacterium]